jgi:predicted transcriptional regulator
MGALEAEVLRYLWDQDDAATPADVQRGIDADVAYTTVMTVLTRLWQKGLVDREPAGKAYAYTARLDEAEYTARAMEQALDRASNRADALMEFARSLSRRDLRVLRKAVGGG